MFDPSVIFQRTHEGRAEIKQKSHGLTQSERLVLIMVDGVSTYQQARDKLPALTDDRFNRAMRKLHQKELILEVFMPTAEDEAEQLSPEVIDRFLQQDVLDPVTIIMFDPEDELGGIPTPASSPYRKAADNPPVAPAPRKAEPPLPSLPPVVDATAAPAVTPEPAAPEQIAVPPAPEPLRQPKEESRAEPVAALDDVHKEMADSLARELQERQLARATRRADRPEMPPPQLHFPVPKPGKLPEKTSLTSVHWGYWLMGIGTLFIAGYFVI